MRKFSPDKWPIWNRSSLALRLLAGLVILLTLLSFIDGMRNPEGVPYSGAGSLMARVASGEVIEVRQEGDKIVGKTESGEELVTYVASRLTTDMVADVRATCEAAGAQCNPELAVRTTASGDNNLMTAFISMLPILVLLGLIGYSMRAGGGIFGIGKSTAKIPDPERPEVSFADVAGADEAKVELAEVVDFLRNPDKYLSMGAKIPRGVLMAGAPGTGKTLMARAVASEAGVPFFHLSASEFIEMIVGVGAARVRDLFKKAREQSPAIIFIDEIDAIGRRRGGSSLGGGHDEREQTLNQILVEMDGFDQRANVVVVAATNRPDVLDPALLRPGRFDRTVLLDPPDLKGREAILKVHGRGKPLHSDVDLRVLARETPGMTGADLANVMNEAAISAAGRGGKEVAMIDLRRAVERVVAGPERTSHLLGPDEKWTVAVHETGHALVQHRLPGCDPVIKVTIVSRGMALGYTMALPEEEKRLKARGLFLDQLAGLLAGSAAEMLFFDDVTTGAANDISKATEIARKMVTEWGMSERIGPVLIENPRFDDERRLPPVSEETSQAVDAEVRELLENARKRAGELLRDERAVVERIARRLMEVETLDGAAFAALANEKSA